ncbi:hypothetical protein BKA58DRAFT_374275 [Alternaria rosae]|uniref:uncharacterized protein n=1 Tax=Alternaria rosae TaxID=1187941 RepID=UPI001E8E3E49|nr:uncharacterized protein BKA58DRAFT_374275 [Alternaria rosae]KAH6883003.1 hypothetical protein BKA58DRAFT_374275 [Alternaria rosae]
MCRWVTVAWQLSSFPVRGWVLAMQGCRADEAWEPGNLTASAQDTKRSKYGAPQRVWRGPTLSLLDRDPPVRPEFFTSNSRYDSATRSGPAALAAFICPDR